MKKLTLFPFAKNTLSPTAATAIPSRYGSVNSAMDHVFVIVSKMSTREESVPGVQPPANRILLPAAPHFNVARPIESEPTGTRFTFINGLFPQL